MPSNRTLRTLLACTGWVIAGALGGLVTGITLFVVMMALWKSEAIGQGMFLIIAEMILLPVGTSIGFAKAIAIWEKNSARTKPLRTPDQIVGLAYRK